ncbi:hypothetical protein M0802_014479 [Mischocyttarus mexicanus]|nr:hypothetical protein M0802_014479 [Mischocyttarus mexicanus]
MSDNNEVKCLLCRTFLNDGRPQRKIELKAISRCISASLKRKDNVHKDLMGLTRLIVHESCSKVYSSEDRIRLYLRKRSNSKESPQYSKRTYVDNSFDFKKLCFICSKDASEEFIKKQKKKERNKRRVVKHVTNTRTKGLILEKLNNRYDSLALYASSRISKVPDLVSINARYHDDCMWRLSKKKPDFLDSEESIAAKAARFISEYMITNKERTCQFNMFKILDQFETDRLPLLKYIIEHLKDNLGDDVIIHKSTEGPIITFANVDKQIITTEWYKKRCADETEERLRFVKNGSKIILQDIKNTFYDTKNYSAPNCFLKNAKEDIPNTLFQFLSDIIMHDKSEPENYEPVIIAIAHAIIAAVRPKSFVSSVQVGLATMLNKQYKSKELIQVLHSLGFCSSYEELQFLETSILNHNEVTTFHESYTQQVSDNPDQNASTIDNQNTLHAMSSILVTPSELADSSTVIKRVKKIPSPELIGKFGKINVRNFHKPSHIDLQSILVKDLNEISPMTLNIEIEKPDFFYYCKYKNPDSEGLNGTMKIVTDVMTFNPSRIIFLPFSKAHPSKLDVIYTILLEADKKRTELKQEHIFVTFDQSLYYKAREILEYSKEELSGVKCRLSGFHVLMSFIRSIGSIMEGSGIDKLFSTIYAENSVDKILLGHTYSQAIRGHILVHSALAQHIVSSFDLKIEDKKSLDRFIDSKESSDLEKLVDFFNKFDPFLRNDKIICISSGLQGNSNVNCHNALEIGTQLMQNISENNFNELKFLRKNKVISLQSMNTVKIGNEEIDINPMLILQRISVAIESKTDLKNYFTYELAPYPLSIFNSNVMRKTQKSEFYDCFKPINKLDLSECRYVVDGGFLLHKIIWPQGQTFDTILNYYVDFVKQHYSPDSIIVFNGYSEYLSASTKTAVHKRIQAKQQCSEITFFNPYVITTENQEKFLSNDRNKNVLIQMLCEKLEKVAFQTIQAIQDADYLLIQVAANIAHNDKTIIIVSENIDVLVILIQYLQKSNDKIYFMKPSNGTMAEKIYDRDSFLYPSIKHLIAFIHAFSGCDCTSAFFNKSKMKLVKMLLNNRILALYAANFYIDNVSANIIEEAGKQIIINLYGGEKYTNTNLDTLRYTLFKNESKKKHFNLASLPPTDSAANFHCRRVYCQVQQWLGNQIDETNWGWKIVNDMLEPIQTNDPLIPETLLLDISCKCKVKCEETCNCIEHGLNCCEYCANCNGQSCDNTAIVNYNEIDFNIKYYNDILVNELEYYFQSQPLSINKNSENENECDKENVCMEPTLSNM